MASLLPVLAVVLLSALLGCTATTPPQSLATSLPQSTAATPPPPSTARTPPQSTVTTPPPPSTARTPPQSTATTSPPPSTTKTPPQSTATTPSQSTATTPPQSTATTPPQSTATTPPQSTATTPKQSPTIIKSAKITASRYSGCPPSPLEGCSCYDTDGITVVTVYGEDGTIETCIAGLSDSGHTTLYQLTVFDYPTLNLTNDLFKAVQVEILYFENTTIQRVDENFLGNSRNFTKIMQFHFCSLLEGIPKINAGVLSELYFHRVDYSPHISLTLRKAVFSGTPALEELTIHAEDRRLMTVQRHAFRSLTKLRIVDLQNSVRLRWGAGHFASPDLTLVAFGRETYDTFQADPGSFSGIPAGAELNINGAEVIGGFSPSKFFNILSGGARISVQHPFSCGCDLAWIRYSSFLGQVYIRCMLAMSPPIFLERFDLSHCKF